ncbi:MAG: NDP-sugar synthase [Candidatus Margulisiibacteriota bacterium]
MKAVIIAGGYGTRLRPLTYNTPKPIVPVANLPFVLHQIELLRRHGIKEVVLNLHYLMGNIQDILEDGKKHGVKIHYSIEKYPLGTAGAVKNAEEFFDDEPLIVINGDILTDIDLTAMIALHKKKKAKVTLSLTRVEDPTAYGLVLADHDGRITHFVEKPSWEKLSLYASYGATDRINAGFYVIDPSVFKDVPKGKEHSFERQLFPSLLEAGAPMYAYYSDRYWIDIGKPSQYRQAHEAILRSEVEVKLGGAKDGHGVWLGEGVKIDKTAKVVGPTLIGDKVVVGPETKINEYSIIGHDVTIGAESLLERAIVWQGSKIGNHVNLSGCIVGFNCTIKDDVRIGEGVILADNSVIERGSIINA